MRLEMEQTGSKVLLAVPKALKRGDGALDLHLFPAFKAAFKAQGDSEPPRCALVVLGVPVVHGGVPITVGMGSVMLEHQDHALAPKPTAARGEAPTPCCAHAIGRGCWPRSCPSPAER